MASIQVLELRPLEYEVEDLSSDMVGSIRGGFTEENLGIFNCLGRFFNDLEDPDVSATQALGNFFDCLALITNL